MLNSSDEVTRARFKKALKKASEHFSTTKTMDEHLASWAMEMHETVDAACTVAGEFGRDEALSEYSKETLKDTIRCLHYLIAEIEWPHEQSGCEQGDTSAVSVESQS
jgi:hypothetical protein